MDSDYSWVAVTLAVGVPIAVGLYFLARVVISSFDEEEG